MKIIKNTSAFDSTKLRSLFSFIHNQIAKYEGKLSYWKSLNIQIQSKTTSTYSGRAYLGKYHSKKWDMFLSIADTIDLYELSQLFAHELMHNYGYRHHQFNRDPLDKKQMDEIKQNFCIEDFIKKPKVKKQINRVAQRYERMLKRQKSWNRKLKLATTNLAKVEKEIKRYEKVHSEEKRTTKYLDPVERKPKQKIDWESKVRELAEKHDLYIEDGEYDYENYSRDRWVSIDGDPPRDYSSYDRTKSWRQWYYITLRGLEIKAKGLVVYDHWYMNE